MSKYTLNLLSNFTQIYSEKTNELAKIDLVYNWKNTVKN